MHRLVVPIVIAVALALIAGGYFFFVKEEVEIGQNPNAQAISGGEGHGGPSGWKYFENEQYGFALYVPPNLNLVPYDEGSGARTFSFEDTASGDGFQIFVVPYFEDTISQERFLQDAPSGVRNDVTEITVDGISANAFISEHMLMGETREVWFIKDDYLYEVTSYKKLDTWLMEIMNTWRFTR